VKPGTRALGVAESFGDGPRSTLGGAVVRADRVVEGFEFGTCTVGGTDATAAVADLWTRLDRPDVRWLLLAGIAPAWFNVLDIRRLHERLDQPVLAVTFEASDEPLSAALEREFSGEALAERRETYERQPPLTRLRVDGETLFVRAAGCPDDEAHEAVRAFTAEGGRPEPLRVARQAARAARTFRERWK
jgi:endonuclease V-like protein UPF0215 family